MVHSGTDTYLGVSKIPHNSWLVRNHLICHLGSTADHLRKQLRYHLPPYTQQWYLTEFRKELMESLQHVRNIYSTVQLQVCTRTRVVVIALYKSSKLHYTSLWVLVKNSPCSKKWHSSRALVVRKIQLDSINSSSVQVGYLMFLSKF